MEREERLWVCEECGRAGRRSERMGMKKNDQVPLDVVDQGVGGEGIGKVGAYPVFIEGALPGERVEVRLLKVNKNYGFGKLLQVLEPSPHRQEAPCPYYDRCGGCHLMHEDYEGQLKFKRKRVQDALERIGGIRHVEVEETIGMAMPFRYRNKVQLPLGLRNGKVEAGFYARRSHRIVDIDACIVQHEDGDAVLSMVRGWMERHRLKPWQVDGEKVKEGLLRHLMVRKGFGTGELMVVLVSAKRDVPHLLDLLQELRTLEGFCSLVVNVNDQDTNLILGPENIVVYGEGHITDTIGSLTFKISPHSFFQVNPAQTEVMYEKALAFAGLTGEEVVFDAYCGTGTISLFLSRQAKKVYGMEVVPSAVEDARENARRNGIANVEFLLGKAEVLAAGLIAKGVRPDVVVVDPPRKGCDPALLESIRDVAPQRVVYVSCDPGTLARDLGILEGYGFRAQRVVPVDNFPHSYHVETVVLMCASSKAGKC